MCAKANCIFGCCACLRHKLEHNLGANRTYSSMLGINIERDLCIKCLWLTVPANVLKNFVSKLLTIIIVKVRGSQFLITKDLGKKLTRTPRVSCQEDWTTETSSDSVFKYHYCFSFLLGPSLHEHLYYPH